jgi:hypothetical protein
MRSKIVSLIRVLLVRRRTDQDSRPTSGWLAASRFPLLRPERADIAAPELPQRLRWLGGDRPRRIGQLLASGPVLAHFFDFAHLNSIRTLPYLLAWHERYADAGLTLIGAHSPRFSFTSAPEKLSGAIERLRIPYPVADDSRYLLWHDYGCRGWPSLFLWGREGTLRWFHFGEGEYAATEEAIAEELRSIDPGLELPAPLEPLRPEDAPGMLVAPPTEEVFPGGSASEPWTASADADALELEYAAGGAFASVDGEGELRVAIDAEPERAIAVDSPGLYELGTHPRHSAHRLRLRADRGLAVYSLSFAAAIP